MLRAVYAVYRRSTELTQQTNYSRRQDNAGFARPKIDRLNEMQLLLSCAKAGQEEGRQTMAATATATATTTEAE